MADLYGKSSAALLDKEGYSSPDEYKGQGNTRVVKFHGFRYMAATKDPSGNTVLTPVNVNRDEEVSVDQIGQIALRQGERDGAFYTSDELKAKESGGAVATGELDFSTAGEHELAEWIQNEKPTVDEVMDKVGTDKDLANRMLAAENIATDGDPRKGVEAGLTTIIEEG